MFCTFYIFLHYNTVYFLSQILIFQLKKTTNLSQPTNKHICSFALYRTAPMWRQVLLSWTVQICIEIWHLTIKNILHWKAVLPAHRKLSSDTNKAPYPLCFTVDLVCFFGTGLIFKVHGHTGTLTIRQCFIFGSFRSPEARLISGG